jgi:hypothetical protein
MKIVYLLAVTVTLLSVAATLRLELTEKEPGVSLVFETSGKHTFYAISSGK